MRNPKITDLTVDLMEIRDGSMAVMRDVAILNVAGLEIEEAIHVNDGAIEFYTRTDPPRRYKVSLRQLADVAADKIKDYHAALEADQRGVA